MSTPAPTVSEVSADDGRARRGLGVRVRGAAAWVAASMLLTHAVTLVRSVVTARLLSPDAFGLLWTPGLRAEVCETLRPRAERAGAG
jgi:hypothetical protein